MLSSSRRVESDFDAWIGERQKPSGWADNIDAGLYVSVADDGKSVTVDGRFSVDALRELLRLIDEAWKE